MADDQLNGTSVKEELDCGRFVISVDFNLDCCSGLKAIGTIWKCACVPLDIGSVFTVLSSRRRAINLSTYGFFFFFLWLEKTFVIY